MKFIISSCRSQRCCLAVMFLLGSLSTLFAQTSAIVVSPPHNNNLNLPYTISTSNLNAFDLVFYRFSDGYDMSAMKTAANPGASVQRKFKNNATLVSAFIARKGGPIDYAGGNISNPTCATCPVPVVGLHQGEYLRIRKSSWAPFIVPANPLPLVDTKTDPPYITPTLPWFVLPITMKAPQVNAYSDITIPSGMTVMGALVKHKWKQLFISADSFKISDPNVKSFQYSSANNLRINLTATNVNTEFNVYLIVQSNTVLGEESCFGGQMNNSSGSSLGSPSSFCAVTRTNPHDPNTLTAFQTETCPYRSDNTGLEYRVDFQNLGEGVAKTVKVSIHFNTHVLDIHSLRSDMIQTSQPLSSFQVAGDSITFNFENIYLAGLAAEPQPPIEKTTGFVEIILKTNQCFAQLSPPFFYTEGMITFYGEESGFVQYTPTNQVRQYLRSNCQYDPMCGYDGRTAVESVVTLPFTPKCYPTFFADKLYVNSPASSESGSLAVTICDLTGKEWFHNTYASLAGTETQNTLETAALPSGMYMVQVRQGKTVAVFKVIKQ